MSPSGKARQNPEAGDKSSLASAHLDGRDKPVSLPLRLSVARGGLGLELAAPVFVGPLLVDELEVELPGLNYPLDLSKGVKHFRNRRSVLRHASLRIDTSRLSSAWARELAVIWGPDARVRIRPIFEAASRLTSAAEGTSRNNDVSTGVPSLAVTVQGGRKALAFDLVVLSGVSPRIAIDGARVVGRDEPPLLLAMQALDAGLEAAARGASGVGMTLSRTGRSIQLGGLAEAVALLVLPSLGCRLPQVNDQVITRVEHDGGEIRLVLGHRGEPFSAGRRALWVAGTADFLKSADEALGRGDLATARECCLEALEHAPGHPEALLLLSELDLAAGDRGEAAISFLQELDALEGVRFSSLTSARKKLALCRALEVTGRQETVRETRALALADESDAVLQALLGLELAEVEEELGGKRRRLDAAVARAPFLKEVRWARFEVALQTADFRAASADAEQLEAAESSNAKRSTVCRKVGMSFRSIGRVDDALKWLKRALRLSPDDSEVMLRLAESLIDGGEAFRAAELLQCSVRRMVEKGLAGEPSGASESETSTADPDHAEKVREMLSEARFLLGRLLSEEMDVPSALIHLSAVETRTSVGAAARLVEAEIHHSRGQYSARDRALGRLLEAAEMRWIDLAPHIQELRSRLKNWGPSVEPSLLEFSERLVAAAEERVSLPQEK